MWQTIFWGLLGRGKAEKCCKRCGAAAARTASCGATMSGNRLTTGMKCSGMWAAVKHPGSNYVCFGSKHRSLTLGLGNVFCDQHGRDLLRPGDCAGGYNLWTAPGIPIPTLTYRIHRWTGAQSGSPRENPKTAFASSTFYEKCLRQNGMTGCEQWAR